MSCEISENFSIVGFKLQSNCLFFLPDFNGHFVCVLGSSPLYMHNEKQLLDQQCVLICYLPSLLSSNFKIVLIFFLIFIQIAFPCFIKWPVFISQNILVWIVDIVWTYLNDSFLMLWWYFTPSKMCLNSLDLEEVQIR